MGLDMYIERIYGLENLSDITHFNGITNVISGSDIDEVHSEDYETSQIAYWRKANQIHAFFEDQLANGELENCSYYEIPLDTLKLLLKRCNLVKSLMDDRECGESEAIYKLSEEDLEYIQELLPTREGFFFGDTSYDEYYYDDIDSTIEQITPIIEKMEKNSNMKVFYYAWW